MVFQDSHRHRYSDSAGSPRSPSTHARWCFAELCKGSCLGTECRLEVDVRCCVCPILLRAPVTTWKALPNSPGLIDEVSGFKSQDILMPHSHVLAGNFDEYLRPCMCLFIKLHFEMFDTAILMKVESSSRRISAVALEKHYSKSRSLAIHVDKTNNLLFKTLTTIDSWWEKRQTQPQS